MFAHSQVGKVWDIQDMPPGCSSELEFTMQNGLHQPCTMTISVAITTPAYYLLFNT